MRKTERYYRCLILFLLSFPLICLFAHPEDSSTSFVPPSENLPTNKSVQIAILGESYSNDHKNPGFNEEILSRLFTLIREKQPAAVIFTGDMTFGLEAVETSQIRENQLLTFPRNPNYLNFDRETWEKDKYVYNAHKFQRDLDLFLSIKNKSLGENIPFYPLIGPHEAYGPDSINRVKMTFKIENQAPVQATQLGYTVALKTTLFIVFSVADYDAKDQTAIESRMSPSLLQWLKTTLEENRKKYSYIFVVGNEPAFSTTSSSGSYRGLDAYPKARNEFWELLIDNQVLAYICSKEHLYDRSNRRGVWQIISGGGGAPLYRRDFDKAFYHYILLTLPENSRQLPIIQVYDAHGVLNDAFELAPTHYPLYQLRISLLVNQKELIG